MTAAALNRSNPPATTWDLFHQMLPAPLLNDLDPKAPQTAYCSAPQELGAPESWK